MEIKGYRILREISRGPITTVYLANQVALDRPVLLKVLNVQWREEKDLIERFRREAKICARLKHPNIVSIFDFGESGKHFYISMEYVEGQPLHEFIRQRFPLPFPIVLYLAREILSGLAYAHQQGVIHRDIKPANILISNDGTVKIADFGMAMMTDLPGITAQGNAVGTPAYMPPEQALGKKPQPASDLFSLGVTLYELVSGKSPFQGANVAESLHKTLNETPPPLRKLHPEIPEWFSRLVESLLQKDPQKRPGDAARLLREISRFTRIPTEEQFLTYLDNPGAVQFEPPLPEVPPVSEPRTVLRFYLTTIALLGLAIVFVFWLKSKSPTLAPAFSNTDSLSQQAAETLLTSESPVPLEKSDSAGAASIPSTLQGKSPSANRQTSTPAPKSVLPADSIVPATQQAARLFIICTPWAHVYIDGEFKDTTPLGEPLTLAPGRHLLELKNPKSRAYARREIFLTPACTETLRVVLNPGVGYLMVYATPWANVYIDGTLKATTPLSEPLPLEAGKHLVRFQHPNFSAVEDTIEIFPGRTVEKRIRFRN